MNEDEAAEELRDEHEISWIDRIPAAVAIRLL